MVSFVILHYVAYDATINCIESIRKCCKDSDYNIVIVDNASPNDSGEKIEEYVKGSKDCVFLTAESNLGFANGNNLGYKYAKEHFNPDFIVCTNNDIEIETENFANALERVYNETNFHRMGPNIHLPSGRKQNPFASSCLSRKEAENAIKGFEKWLKNVWYYAHIHPFFYTIKVKSQRLWNKLFGKKVQEKSAEYKSKITGNVYLMGAFIVFSRLYIEKEEFAFDPRTFMYNEENIQTYQFEKKGYVSLYDDSISVIHYHRVATNKSQKNKTEALKKSLERNIESLKVYLKILEENGD